MSFSSLVKAELAKTRVEGNCDVIAEIAGFVPMCGSLKFTGDGMILGFNTESAPVARRLFTFLKRYYSDEVNVKFSRSKQLKKNNIYSIVLENESETKMLLDDIDYLRGANVFMPNYAPDKILKDTCCKKSYVRGSFLGAGSVSDPKKYYHLEFVCNNETHSKFLSEIINGFGFKSKIIIRKENYIVYLKEAEQISDLLSLMGAHKSTLEFENIRVFKDVNNQVNRIVNLENANLNKIVDTRIRQLRDIKYIDEHLGIHKLPKNLQEIALLRMKDESLSLKELGTKLNPPIGKSGVNHRFAKIKEIADKLRSETHG